MIKRRNLDCSKLRRSLKKNRIIESLNSNTTAHLKVVVIWVFVLFANHLAGFHFEYLWPVWLMVCSVYDSFKYQGLAFSAFFVGVTVTSDMLCYFLIPIQWLFFSASTFVWVQYVYQTERAVTMQTIGLWFMFVTFEGSLRVQGIKSLPYHIDLCRPFAVHCIGYPMVTLGFGVKSYISYKMRLRRQRETERDNAFLYDLVDLALPEECRQQSRVFNNFLNSNNVANPAPDSLDDLRRNGQLLRDPPAHDSDTSSKASSDTHESRGGGTHANDSASHLPAQGKGRGNLPRPNSGFLQSSGFIYNNSNSSNQSSSRGKKAQVLPQQIVLPNASVSNNGVSSQDLLGKECVGGNGLSQPPVATVSPTVPTQQTGVDSLRLEAELRRLRSELQTFRSVEIELKAQIAVHATNDRMLKLELSQVKQENDMIQTKLQNTIKAREQQSKMVQALEKRLDEEKKQRLAIEQQIANERKAAAKVKAEAAAEEKAKKEAIPKVPVQAQISGQIATVTPTSSSQNGSFSRSTSECGDVCKSKRRELENEMAQIKRELRTKDDLAAKNVERLESMQSQLNQLRESNERLENDLAAEGKLKLRLLTALSETKKVVEQQHALLEARERENQLLQERIGHFVSNLYNSVPNVGSAMPPQASQVLQPNMHQQAVQQVAPGHPAFMWGGASEADLVNGLNGQQGPEPQYMMNSN